MKYPLMVLLGLTFNVAETLYFGWNMKATTPQEVLCDNISVILVVWGVLGDVFKNVKTVHNITINKQ